MEGSYAAHHWIFLQRCLYIRISKNAVTISAKQFINSILLMGLITTSTLPYAFDAQKLIFA